VVAAVNFSHEREGVVRARSLLAAALVTAAIVVVIAAVESAWLWFFVFALAGLVLGLVERSAGVAVGLLLAATLLAVALAELLPEGDGIDIGVGYRLLGTLLFSLAGVLTALVVPTIGRRARGKW